MKKTEIPNSGRKFSQLSRRGRTKESVNNTVNDPFVTRKAENKANGNPATAYFHKDGSYVVRDDITGELVQMSDRSNPSEWIPYDTIIDPYIP